MSSRIHVMAHCYAEAAQWARDQGIPRGSLIYLSSEDTLRGKLRGTEIIVLEGAWRHPQHERIADYARAIDAKLIHESDFLKARG